MQMQKRPTPSSSVESASDQTAQHAARMDYKAQQLQQQQEEELRDNNFMEQAFPQNPQLRHTLQQSMTMAAQNNRRDQSVMDEINRLNDSIDEAMRDNPQLVAAIDEVVQEEPEFVQLLEEEQNEAGNKICQADLLFAKAKGRDGMYPYIDNTNSHLLEPGVVLGFKYYGSQEQAE
uniref:STI1 domain-containing protein n=1 Tax=Macrostomum lignano TaxID=282301 RepID=A0A1I8GFB4_9PLAT